ncbi:MAG: amylo-alpha-1,6-glucosidase [Gammaproteobacteria bacterium]
MIFQYSKETGLTKEKALTLEWLETNGIGGYASSTILNCHTRKYHGLLVSTLPNLSDKYVLLSKLEDTFCYDSKIYDLTAHQYQNAFLDGSFEEYQTFTYENHPVFTFQFGKVTIKKEILLLANKNTVLIKYTCSGAEEDNPIEIKIRPLLAFRNFHTLTRENQELKAETLPCRNGQRFSPYHDLPSIYLQSNNIFNFQNEPLWYRNFSYEKERKRGYACGEDLFTPGLFTLKFDRKGEIIFAASLEENSVNLTKNWKREIKHRNKLAKRYSGDDFKQQLHLALRSFLQKDLHTEKLSIIAGYHWFGAWGRDSMISLPALTLLTSKRKDHLNCLSILRHFASQEKDGLIPNYLGPTSEQNAYNTVDASLWFAWAVQQYYLYTRDLKSIERYLLPTLKNIFNYYRGGTSYGIKMEQNGLLRAGDGKCNITWMDGMVDGYPVINRDGLQVEVNALWYNMLCFLRNISQQLKDPWYKELETIIQEIKISFVETFWNEQIGFLRDFVTPEEPDKYGSNSLRPNQIFAVSLPHSPLPPKIMKEVVKTVSSYLLTPFGLRTLSRNCQGYHGQYQGEQKERDTAYHNGTIWPWLLGHFTEALLKVSLHKKEAIETVRPSLEALKKHLGEAGIGTISEIFSGDDPHKPDGCISQAWSVAEVLRAIYLLEN